MASDSRRPKRLLDPGGGADVKEPSRIMTSGLLKANVFLLDINDKKQRIETEKLIRRHGGHIVHSFFDGKLPTGVISDDRLARFAQNEKKGEAQNKPYFKSLPRLLKEAIQRGIKIRYLDSFVERVNDFIKKRQSTEATATTKSATAAGTKFRGDHVGHQEKMRRPSDATKNFYVRIDEPGRKPDIRFIEYEKVGNFYFGRSAGRAINCPADEPLMLKREKDYEAFVNGKFVAPPKSRYKLNEEETHCHVCNVEVGNLTIHDKSNEHKNKLTRLGIPQAIGRTAEETKIQLEKLEKRNKEAASRKQPTDPSEIENYEYGESSIRLTWSEMAARHQEKIRALAAKSEKLLIFEEIDVDSAYGSGEPPPPVRSKNPNHELVYKFIGLP